MGKLLTAGKNVASKFGNFTKQAYKALDATGDKIKQDTIRPALREMFDAGIDSSEAAARYYKEGLNTTSAVRKFGFEKTASQYGVKDTEKITSVFNRYGLAEDMTDDAFLKRSDYALKELSPAYKTQQKYATYIDSNELTTNSYKTAEIYNDRFKIDDLYEAPPEKISATTAATTSQDLRQLQATSKDAKAMVAAGQISEKDAKQLRQKAIEDYQQKRDIAKARINASYGDTEALKKVDAADARNGSGEPWSSTARVALGTAVVGAGICAALNSNRGQQNNAQLYGQQPLY